MKLLIDEALQDDVAHGLSEAGYDVTHVLVTTDTDFGTILALTGGTGPTVLLLRGIGDGIDERVEAIRDILPRIEYELSAGAVNVLEEDRYRVRLLPIDEA